MTCNLFKYNNTHRQSVICQERVDAEELRERFLHNPECGVQIPLSGLAQKI